MLALLEEPPPNPAETGIFFSNVILNLLFCEFYISTKLNCFGN